MSVEFYIQGVYKIGNDKDFIKQESIIGRITEKLKPSF